MSCVQLSEGGFQVVYPLACGPGHPELSKSYMDMASESFAFTCCAAVCALIARCHTQAKQPHVFRAHRTRIGLAGLSAHEKSPRRGNVSNSVCQQSGQQSGSVQLPIPIRPTRRLVSARGVHTESAPTLAASATQCECNANRGRAL